MSEIVLTDYLRDIASSAYGKAYFLLIAKRTTGIASINKTQLGRFPVPVPPIELQTRYAKLAAQAHGTATAAKDALGRSTALSASLMSSLLEAGA